MPDITGVAHLVLNVTDPEASARFYCDTFGFRVTNRIEAKGIVGLTHPGAGVVLGLRRAETLGSGPGSLNHVAFLVPNRAALDDCARQLVAAGVEARIDEIASGASITLHDPDHNEVEFFAPAAS